MINPFGLLMNQKETKRIKPEHKRLERIKKSLSEKKVIS